MRYLVGYLNPLLFDFYMLQSVVTYRFGGLVDKRSTSSTRGLVFRVRLSYTSDLQTGIQWLPCQVLVPQGEGKNTIAQCE